MIDVLRELMPEAAGWSDASVVGEAFSRGLIDGREWYEMSSEIVKEEK